MEEIRVIVQTQKEYEEEKLKNFNDAAKVFKYSARVFLKLLLSAFIGVVLQPWLQMLFQLESVWITIAGIFFVLYMIDMFSINRKTISYLRTIFGAVYMLIALMFVGALIYGSTKGWNIQQALLGSLIAIGLFGYLGYKNLNKYTNLFRKLRKRVQ